MMLRLQCRTSYKDLIPVGPVVAVIIFGVVVHMLFLGYALYTSFIELFR